VQVCERAPHCPGRLQRTGRQNLSSNYSNDDKDNNNNENNNNNNNNKNNKNTATKTIGKKPQQVTTTKSQTSHQQSEPRSDKHCSVHNKSKY
jgi:hypothetical protein